MPALRSCRCLLVAVAAAGAAMAARADAELDRDPAPRVVVERAYLAADVQPLRDRQGRELNELAGVSVRWWKRHGRVDLGIGIGALGFVSYPDAAGGGMLLAPMPSVTVGWRYRLGGETALYADATGLRRPAADGSMPGIVGTQVGVEWKPARSRFGFENRSFGFQLQSGYRMSLRVRGGGLGVYLRGQF